MFSHENLFDMRSNVGTKLEQLLKERNYTKAQLCKETGVSRPTINKILAGTITSKANYIRHISKILDCLQITPDMLMGNRSTIIENHLHVIRKAMRAKSEEIAEFAGISKARLFAIESGEEATIAELRDIALFLSVGTRCILGEGAFDNQIAIMDDFLSSVESKQFGKGCGFWGHIGILPCGSTEYQWYPISTNAKSRVYRQMQLVDRLVVPCMNNKLLLLNLSNIKQILLLDEACDEPGFANWDPKVDCGDIPQVIYEALNDYLDYAEYGVDRDPDVMSDRFFDVMKSIVEEKAWDEESFFKMDQIKLLYKDGTTTKTDFDAVQSDLLIDAIDTLYNYENDEFVEDMLIYSDLNGTEIIVNMREIAFIELPLIKTEDAICDRMNIE